MRRYIFKRLQNTLMTLLFISVANFFLFRLMPGAPIKMMARSQKLNQSMVGYLENLYGLNQSLPEQFFIYIKNWPYLRPGGFVQVPHRGYAPFDRAHGQYPGAVAGLDPAGHCAGNSGGAVGRMAPGHLDRSDPAGLESFFLVDAHVLDLYRGAARPPWPKPFWVWSKPRAVRFSIGARI